MGDNNETTTSTTGFQNKDLTGLLSQLSKGIGSTYQTGGSTYTAPGANTLASRTSSLSAAGNSDYSSGLADALKSYSNRAAGNELGVNDPLYAAQRAQLTDDVLTSTNTAFNNSGLFGSDQNQFQAARGLATAQGALDTAQRSESYGRQTEAANMLPQLLQSSLLPSSLQGSVGASEDADAAAKANGGLNYQSQYAQLLAALAGSSPTTTSTTTPTTPWWQSLIGTAIAAA